MRLFFRLYSLLSILSIDIVAGAVVCAMFFAKLFQVQIRLSGLIALSLTVWIIYTADHLRDAKRISHVASTARHRFHQQHFKLLLTCLLIAISINVVAIFFIRPQVFEFGILLAAMVVVYLIIQQSLRFLKELFIAALYTCGVLLPSVSITSIELTTIHYLIILQFGCIAWANLILFAWFDQVYDQHDRQNSFVTVLGRVTTAYFLCTLFLFSMCFSIFQYFLGGSIGIIAILGLMNSVLLLIFIFRARLAQNDSYRLVGDAVFLFPVIFLMH